MKSFIKYYRNFGLGLVLTMMWACSDQAVEPTLSVSAPATVSAGETVDFTITGSAETFVIYTGDMGHMYDSSYLAIAEGMAVDLESVVLTQDSLNVLLPWLENQVDNYNASADTQIDYAEISTNLQSFVGSSYAYRQLAIYEITDQVMPELPFVANIIVESYYTDNSIILAPNGGYHTGEAIDRYNLNFSYVYNTPGEYVVTVIASNVSTKNYSGSGYKFNRTVSANEYDVNRVMKQVTITVQ